jgi:hypothetical protein
MDPTPSNVAHQAALTTTTIFTPHGFTSRSSRPEVGLATSDVSNGAVFLFQCRTRRSLSHVHQGLLGLGTFGLGKVDEKQKEALKSFFHEEIFWVVTGGDLSDGLKKGGGSPLADLRTCHPDFARLSMHVFFDKLLDESNGKAWTIMVRALERELLGQQQGGKKANKKTTMIHVYTSPARVPKAPLAAHWLMFPGNSDETTSSSSSASHSSGEAGQLVPAGPEARKAVEPYYSLACYVDVAALLILARSNQQQHPHEHLKLQQLRLYCDGWLRDGLRRHLHLPELTRAIEQVAHSPGGDELLEEIQGKELLLNHLVHWDGFEKDALLMQPHQCDHDHDHDDHHHHHGHGHGQQPTLVPRQVLLQHWLSAESGNGEQTVAASQTKKKRKKRHKKKSAQNSSNPPRSVSENK